MQTNTLYYIEQSVTALPGFEESESSEGTVVDHTFQLKKIDSDSEGELQYIAFLRLVTDLEESDNPPFEFALESMLQAILTKEEEAESFDLIKRMIFQMMVAASRERLASLTSRTPWGVFNLQPMPYAQMNELVPDSDEEE